MGRRCLSSRRVWEAGSRRGTRKQEAREGVLSEVWYQKSRDLGISFACKRYGRKRAQILHAVLLADRTTVRGPTGRTPFYLNYGREAVLPIEMEIPTWRLLDWPSVKSREDLLALRAQQLLRRDEDLEEATLRLQRKRIERGEQFDESRQVRMSMLEEGAIVLVHDAAQEVDMSRRSKIGFRWLLQELDGTLLAGTFAGNRLKRFIRREGFMISADDVSESPDQGFNPAAGLNEDDIDNDIAGTPEPVNHPEVSRHSEEGLDSRQRDLQLLIPPGKSLAVVI